MRFRILSLVSALSLACAAPAAGQGGSAGWQSPFSDWAGFFIAGDFRASTGAPSDVFDNGRRDVAQAFIDAGLHTENTVHFSVHHLLQSDRPKPLTESSLIENMTAMAQQATGGCVFFYTSHGSPQVLVMGQSHIDPASLDWLLDTTCGERPTLVLISACYSGSFVPGLSAENRMILTAARADRSSFGCGEEDVYTFFDGCVLEVMPASESFTALADRVRACVERREAELALGPPSEPQMAIGQTFGDQMGQYALARSYQVRPGDTLPAISSAMYGRPDQVALIRAANPDVFSRPVIELEPGLKLKIPPD